jgi:hypothetical protein
MMTEVAFSQGDLRGPRVLSYTGRPTKKIHGTAFPVADPSIPVDD